MQVTFKVVATLAVAIALCASATTLSYASSSAESGMAGVDAVDGGWTKTIDKYDAAGHKYTWTAGGC